MQEITEDDLIAWLPSASIALGDLAMLELLDLLNGKTTLANIRAEIEASKLFNARNLLFSSMPSGNA